MGVKLAKDIEHPPNAAMLIESTRAIGYSLETAIADIIDNSISAKAKQIEIEYFPMDDAYITILDDGIGMSESKLTESMRYSSADPNSARDDNDLGRFGLGMKMASFSQCRCLTVISKFEGKIFARQWDIDYIKTTGSWSLRCLTESDIIDYPSYEKLYNQETGTIVIWQKLDRVFAGGYCNQKIMTDKMHSVNKHLSLVFHRYLKGGDAAFKTKIISNCDEIEGFDPFYSSKSYSNMDEEKIPIPHNGTIGTVTIVPYILPHHSKMTQKEIDMYDGMRLMQGFYVYRNKRLLTWGTWFKLSRQAELSKLARVKIDIPNTLDDLWTLDIKKSTAIPPDVVKNSLKRIIGKIIEGSKRTFTKRERKLLKDDITHIWDVIDTRDGKKKYQINKKHPLYESLIYLIDDDAKKLLDKYIYSIAEYIPIDDLHLDFSSQIKFNKDDDDKALLQIKELLEVMLDKVKTNKEKITILENALITEPYNNFPDYINSLIEDLSYENA